MKKVVLDANIVFAALRVHHSRIRKGLFDKNYLFYCPNFLIVEIFKHKERIISKSKISEEETYEALSKLIEKIHFVSEENISIGSFVKAYELCRGIDEKDVPFVALSLELDCEYWTRDNALKIGLRKRGFNHFFEEKEIT